MTDQLKQELLPCPHCGNDAAISHRPSGFGQRPNGFRAECKSRFTTCPVNSRTHHADTEHEAITAWNTRAAMQPAPVTPQQAAKVLLDFLATPSALSPVPHGTLEEIWQATFRESGFLAVRGFLAATATEAAE